MSEPRLVQHVGGSGNIFTGTGNIHYEVTYALSPTLTTERVDLLALLQKVRHHWILGVLEQSLHGAALISLGQQAQHGAVQHPWQGTHELPASDFGHESQTSDVDRAFERSGRLLLLLGEPGSGKTIALLSVVRARAAAAELDPTQPVPVVFNLASWGEKRLPLTDWLVGEMRLRYQIAARASREWIESGRLMLCLDGLDEVQAVHRAACVNAINDFAQSATISGLLVSCRALDYHALPQQLRLNAALALQPLSAEQVDRYLRDAGDRLTAVRDAVAADEAWAEMVRTPLMLDVIALAYSGASTEEVAAASGDSVESLRARIFRAYVARAFARKPVLERSYPRTDVMRWLTWLAEQMQLHSQSLFAIEQLQPSWLSGRRELRAYVLASRLAATAVMVALILLPRLADIVLGAWAAAGKPGERSASHSRLESFVLTAGSQVGAQLFVGALGTVVIGGAAGALAWIAWRGRLGGMVQRLLGRAMKWLCSCVLLASAAPAGVVLLLRAVRTSPDSDIEPVEAFRWDWSIATQRSWTAAKWSALIGCGSRALLMFFFVLTWTDSSISLSSVSVRQLGPIVIEFAKLAIVFAMLGATAGFAIGGFTPKTSGGKARPNEGILLSVRHSFLVLLGLGFLLRGFGIALSYSGEEVSNLLWVPVFDWQGFPDTVAVQCAMWFGGLAAAQHYVLRVMLWRRGYAPLSIAGVLAHGEQLVLLQRVGGSYQFVHRYLREYLANVSWHDHGPVR